MKIEIKPEPASVCCPVFQEIFRSQVAHDQENKRVTIHGAISPQSCARIQELVSGFKPHHSLEIGYAMGVSTLEILCALEKQNCGHHTAIHPNQTATQGIASQQALSCSVPIFAWDRGGPRQDPPHCPRKVVFSPVTPFPYWDERRGHRFSGLADFEARWPLFCNDAQCGQFALRNHVLGNRNLEKCARGYIQIARTVEGAS